jgi:methylglyoxal synthase
MKVALIAHDRKKDLMIGIYKIFQSEKRITGGVSQVCKMFHALKMMSSCTG